MKKNWISFFKMTSLRSTILLLMGIFVFQAVPTFIDKINLIADRIPIITSADSSNYKNVIRDDVQLDSLIKQAKAQFKDRDSTYLYIDLSDDAGTMNYYRMRYALLPFKSVKYQYYGYEDFNEELYVKLIQEFDVDYILIHKNNGILEYLGDDYKDREDIIIEVNNKSATNLLSQLQK